MVYVWWLTVINILKIFDVLILAFVRTGIENAIKSNQENIMFYWLC